jgi:hypothetical protein
MRKSRTAQTLLLLLAVLVVSAALSTPLSADYGECYTVNPMFCEYYSGGWCRSGCSPECSGDVSGEIMVCFNLPQECCY